MHAQQSEIVSDCGDGGGGGGALCLISTVLCTSNKCIYVHIEINGWFLAR